MKSLIRQTTPTYEVVATLVNGSGNPLVAIVQLNHAYDVKQKRFIPRMGWGGEPVDYQEYARMQWSVEETDDPEQLSPVNSVSQEGSIGELIKEEIDKLFKEQTGGWWN